MTVLNARSNPVSMCDPCAHPPKKVSQGMMVPLCLGQKLPVEAGWWSHWHRSWAVGIQRPSNVGQQACGKLGANQAFSCKEPLRIPKSMSSRLREPTYFFWTWLVVKTIGYSDCMDFKGRTPNVIWPRQLWPFIASIFLRYCCQGLKCLHAPWF